MVEIPLTNTRQSTRVGGVRIERLEPTERRITFTCVRSELPGFAFTADVERLDGRLVITRLEIGHAPHPKAVPAEITRAVHRAAEPAALLRALIVHLECAPTADEAIAWFLAHGSQTGADQAENVKRAQTVATGLATPRGRGRPPKIQPRALADWAHLALRVSGGNPRSLHEALAAEMRKAGLSDATRATARDLVFKLRAAKLLAPAPRAGSRDPLQPGPALTSEAHP
jgi:hypothetical protein